MKIEISFNDINYLLWNIKINLQKHKKWIIFLLSFRYHPHTYKLEEVFFFFFQKESIRKWIIKIKIKINKDDIFEGIGPLNIIRGVHWCWIVFGG